MNIRPQRTELRSRLTPKSGGYDFHSSLRRLAQRLTLGGEPLQNLLLEAETISQVPEKLSAQNGLRQLSRWRAQNLGAVSDVQPATIESASGLYRVRFTPNFGLRIGDQTVAIHVWNTTKPRLEPRLTRAMMSLFEEFYSSETNRPDDLAVLCLRTMRLIRLGDGAEVAELGRLIAVNIDLTLNEIADELGEPSSLPTDQPPATPPGE